MLRSLRSRLLLATLTAALAVLCAAGVLLASLFRDHVLDQFSATLTAQLDRLAAVIEFDVEGRPKIDLAALGDPRWQRPYSGLYWQIDELPVHGPKQSQRPARPADGAPDARSGAAAGSPGQGDRAIVAVLRSRSLWDTALAAPADAIADGMVHRHAVPGPAGTTLWLVERSVRADASGGRAWRLLVAADLHETQAAIARFNGALALGLAALLGLLTLGAWAQVSVGLAPLKTLRSALAALRDGRVARLEGRFPLEVQPLVDDFNGVLDRHDELVSRARTHAGNLAHALKTSLAAMSQSAAMAAGAVSRASPAAQGPDDPAQAQRALTALPSVVRDQVARAQRQVDWHLARARAAAAHGVPGIRAEVGPTLAGLSRVMARVHAGRGLVLDVEPVEPGLAFAGESQDLQEMAGNVIDNACKWARHRVRVSSQSVTGATRPRLRIVVDDDGPGIDAESRSRALQRGVRLDETVPGSGLGLAIVHELATLYEGRLGLEDAPGGGLRVVLELPAAGGLHDRSSIHRASPAT